MQSNPSGRLLIHLSTGAEGRPVAWEISDWSQSGSDETTSPSDETIFGGRHIKPKTNTGQHHHQ
jgi:hypothetical protein